MKPILFNTENVKAILDGRKSVTRRVVKPKYREDEGGFQVCTNIQNRERWVEKCDWDEGSFDSPRYITPPYRPDDILYVRETWYQTPNGMYWYKADNICQGCTELGFCLPKGVPYHKTCDLCEYLDGCENIKWRPSIHMPKEAARLFLRVTDVRVERLQEIDYDGCKAEGICDDYKTYSEKYHENLAVRAYPIVFAELWDSTIKKADLPRYGWDANPWVFVIEFERISKEEAFTSA